jgi:hypothetical protein
MKERIWMSMIKYSILKEKIKDNECGWSNPPAAVAVSIPVPPSPHAAPPPSQRRRHLPLAPLPPHGAAVLADVVEEELLGEPQRHRHGCEHALSHPLAAQDVLLEELGEGRWLGGSELHPSLLL